MPAGPAAEAPGPGPEAWAELERLERRPREPRGCRSVGLALGLGCLLFVVALGVGIRVLGDRVVDLVLEAQRAQARGELRAIRQAVQRFERERGAPPAALAELVRLDRLGASTLVDPWDRTYAYDPATGEARCLGVDGAPGGEGPDADFGPDAPRSSDAGGGR